MNLDHAVEIAQTAERGQIDLLFLADGNAVRQMDKPALFAANSPSDRPAVFEPVTLMSAVAKYTKHIGLLSTATTTYEEPYLAGATLCFARSLSKGRACWNIVTTSYPDDSLNFSRTEHVAGRALRARQRVRRRCARACGTPGPRTPSPEQATGQFLDPRASVR